MDLSSTTYVAAHDGTRLAAHHVGVGRPLACLPGGPMLDTDYLGELGGLSAHRRLVLLDPRGTGASDAPADPSSYRLDRQVADVEAHRVGLGLERLDLLAHSAGANLAYRYAERHPDRVGRLVLVTPSVLGIGVDIAVEDRLAMVRQRAGEEWYAEAAAAYGRIAAGEATDDDWGAISPFMHGHLDDETRDYDAEMDARRDAEVIGACVADGAFDPPATRAALAWLDAPVLVLAGAVDIAAPPSVMAEVAALFPHAEVVVQPGAGHFPWRDDPDAFVALIAPFVS